MESGGWEEDEGGVPWDKEMSRAKVKTGEGVCTLKKESVSICSTSLAQKDAGCDVAKQDRENSLSGRRDRPGLMGFEPGCTTISTETPPVQNGYFECMFEM